MIKVTGYGIKTIQIFYSVNHLSTDLDAVRFYDLPPMKRVWMVKHIDSDYKNNCNEESVYSSPSHFNISDSKQRIATYIDALCRFSGATRFSSDLSGRKEKGDGRRWENEK